MDVRQLQALVAVAEHGTFSGAAKALHTVQSNVSAHVARLERELGVTLVDRQSGRLTAEGAAVVTRARRVHAELDAIRGDVARLGTELSGDVRFGVIGTTARWLAAGLLDGLREQHPRIRTVIVEASTTSLSLQLLSGHLDLAVVNLPADDVELATEPLFEEDLVLVAPTGHPLAQRDRVNLAQLGDYPLLLSAPGTALRDELELQAARAGVRLQPQAELDGVRLAASLAFQGFGAAVLPATAIPTYVTGAWKRVPVRGLARRSVGLAHKRRGLLSPQAEGVAAIVRAVVRAQATDQPGLHPALPSST
ncbi:MAG TPA: LysR family transcriptional regulator [Acidimicrobiales bacterium]|nr:LysR family transcriptional regulator [Acidimicrobiales bacterium]